jgi:hypothetical protein
MGMLKFCAVHLNHRPRITVQHFGRSFDHASFPGTGRSKEKQISQWAPWRAKSSSKYLVQIDHGLDGFILPDDFSPQSLLKISRLYTALVRI